VLLQKLEAKMFNYNKKIILSWIAVFIWMLLIFKLSAQPATQSSELSRNVTKVIIETIGKVIPLDIEISTTTDLVSQFNHTVRKFAHGAIYFVLGVLLMNALRASGVENSRGVILALFICVLYAISDEVHQLFVPGRGGQIKDVIIDSFGAVVGIGFYLGFCKLTCKGELL